jgi:hypothetical protein
MLRYLYRLPGGEIQYLGLLVGTARDNFLAVLSRSQRSKRPMHVLPHNLTYLEKVDGENRSIVLYLCLPLALTIAQDLVYADLFVPAGHGKKVLQVGRVGVESKIGDAIFRRAGELDIILQVAEGVTGRRRCCSKETRHTCGRCTTGLFSVIMIAF